MIEHLSLKCKSDEKDLSEARCDLRFHCDDTGTG